MYVGYYSALSHHGLTEQVPQTVYIVTPTRAQSREIHGVPYRCCEERTFHRRLTHIFPLFLCLFE